MDEGGEKMVLAAQADGLTAGKGHKGRDIRERGKEGGWGVGGRERWWRISTGD